MKTNRVIWKRMVIVPIAFVLASFLSAEDGAYLTPELVAKLRSVTEVKISPNGRFVAFVLSVPRQPGVDEDGSSWSELHLIDIKDNIQKPFITGEGNVSFISWTPDSRNVSFLAKRGDDETTALYTIPADGGEAQKRVALKTSLLSYAWSPDSLSVAVVATEPLEDEFEELKKKGFSQEVYEENKRQRRLYIASVTSTNEEPRPVELRGSVYLVRWSPKGDRIAVSVAPTPLVDDRYMFQRVQIIDAESGVAKVRFDNPGKLEDLVWSPDGSQIALRSGIDLYDPSAGRILVASSDGGPLSKDLNDPSGDASALIWPESGRIIYINARGVETSLDSMKPDGSDRRTYLRSGDQILESVSISDDQSRAVFRASRPTHPSEVYLWEKGTEAARRLTISNEWLEKISLAPQEKVTFKARDGLELEGLLIRPLNEKAGQRYPLILVVHGGPESHHQNGWLTSYSRLGQMAAAKGIAVFHTNYRGSTGRGVEFSKTSQADPAGKEFDDLLDAVDHLIGIGLVDQNKVGITGGSYGGYATAWCSTYYSERFAAGVMSVGISNKVSKVGTTDIPNEEFYVHARKRVWDDWQFFLERSPVYHAEKGKTPLLILHGKDDPRVNVGQSRELYRHLKLSGKAPLRLVLYPGEGHGNRRAASRYDFSLRALRWFEHYLMGPGGDPPASKVDYKVNQNR